MSSNVGRRPNTSNTKEQILQAARQIFAERGYAGATIRGIASQVSVDPALVIHFFENKENLFAEAVAPIYEPLQQLPHVLQGDRQSIGDRLATYIVDLLESPDQGKIAVGLVRASLLDSAAAQASLFEENILRAFTAAARQDSPALRANLVCSAYIGYVTTRYVYQLSPLATASRQQAIALLQPVLQRYLEEDI